MTLPQKSMQSCHGHRAVAINKTEVTAMSGVFPSQEILYTAYTTGVPERKGSVSAIKAGEKKLAP